MGKARGTNGNKTKKELGKGIYQLKNGRYSARVVVFDAEGHKLRPEKHFDKLNDAIKWRDEMLYKSNNGGLPVFSTVTIDEWFNKWINEVRKPAVRPNTLRNDKDRYELNVKEQLGKYKVIDIKPAHCQKIMSKMLEENYSKSVIKMTWRVMYQLFEYAVDNEIISKNPMTSKTVYRPRECDIKKEQKKKMVALSIEEMNLFLENAKNTSNYKQFRFALETGLRTGEIIGLMWEDIDFENKTLTIRRTVEYRHQFKKWHIGPPKTENSNRTIPLSKTSYDILKELYINKDKRVVCDKFDIYKTVAGNDEKVDVNINDFVFLNRKGLPTKNSAYDTSIYKICDKAGIRHFAMHILRHTYCTRALEAGMSVKDVSERAGHSSVAFTLDRYADVLEELKTKNTDLFDDYMSKCIISA